MEAWHYLLLAVLGCVSGTLNVIAGGGSLLTLPAMVLLGMEGPVANGTNRVAILAQNLTAISTFRSRGFSEARLSLTLALATLPGAVCGALAGTMVRGVLFNRMLAGILIGVLILTALKERRAKRDESNSRTEDEAAPQRRWLGLLCMAGIGFYGGFIQAGVGFLLMAVLHQVLGLDLIRVNMHKVFVVAVFTLAALAIFAWRGHVMWMPGLALAAGNSLGGWLGSHLSISRGAPLIRRVLSIALLAMAVRLLWL